MDIQTTINMYIYIYIYIYSWLLVDLSISSTVEMYDYDRSQGHAYILLGWVEMVEINNQKRREENQSGIIKAPP